MGRPKINFDDQYIPEPNSGCWLWIGARDSSGYGFVWPRSKAHRLSYERSVGPIPDGYVVCHKCDTPCCVNPSHLFVGTIKDNNDDKVAKGRHIMPSGKQRKLKVDEVVQILASSDSCRALADRFGVSDANISYIRLGRTWKHIPRPPGYSYTPYETPSLLDSEMVELAKSMHAAGQTYRAIGDVFGVSLSVVHRHCTEAK